MSEDSGILDEDSWLTVYFFFHPEEESEIEASSLFSDLFSGVMGITSGSQPDAIASSGFYSGRPACLVWAAEDGEDARDYWRAQIMVSSGQGFDETVVVSVTDSQGENIDSATLILLNSTLEVTAGTATYSLAEFQRNLANTNVELIYPDGRRVPGGFRMDEF